MWECENTSHSTSQSLSQKLWLTKYIPAINKYASKMGRMHHIPPPLLKTPSFKSIPVRKYVEFYEVKSSWTNRDESRNSVRLLLTKYSVVQKCVFWAKKNQKDYRTRTRYQWDGSIGRPRSRWANQPILTFSEFSPRLNQQTTVDFPKRPHERCGSNNISTTPDGGRLNT